MQVPQWHKVSEHLNSFDDKHLTVNYEHRVVPIGKPTLTSQRMCVNRTEGPFSASVPAQLPRYEDEETATMTFDIAAPTRTNR